MWDSRYCHRIKLPVLFCHEVGDVEESSWQNFRESISGGQHNSRSNKTYLKTIFSTFIFPDEMTEKDELWILGTWEKEDEGKMCQRLERGLGEAMQRSEGCTCTSIHSSPYFRLHYCLVELSTIRCLELMIRYQYHIP